MTNIIYIYCRTEDSRVVDWLLTLHYVTLQVPDTPVEVLVDLLTKAKELAAASGNVSEELTRHLQKAVDIASGLDLYLEKMTTQESETLEELYKYVLAYTNSHLWLKIL